MRRTLLVDAVRILLIAGLVAPWILLSGCQSLSKSREASYVVSLHYCAMKPSLDIKHKVYYGGDRQAYIRKSQVLASVNIPRIETYAVDGGSGLRLYLDNHGRFVWTQISGGGKGRLLALMVEGELMAFLRIDAYNDRGIIEISGPFNTDKADTIARHAERNYELFN